MTLGTDRGAKRLPRAVFVRILSATPGCGSPLTRYQSTGARYQFTGAPADEPPPKKETPLSKISGTRVRRRREGLGRGGTARARARRDAFAWDCRAIASTLAALDRVVRDAVLRDEDEDEDERGEDEDERGEARTRSDEARRTVGSSRVLAATSRALVRRAALLLAPADDVRAALPEIARLAVSGVTLAPGDDDRVGSFAGSFEERAAHLSTLAESAFGRAPSPESLWDPRDPAWDRPPPSDEWAWIPRDDPARTAASLLDGDRVITGDGDERLSKTPTHSAPWPCPREAREAHEALERSWREAEAAEAARASAEERWAALAARSELADDDQTPLDEKEEAERKALRDAVAAAAAARAGGGGGETRRPAGAVKKPSASARGP